MTISMCVVDDDETQLAMIERLFRRQRPDWQVSALSDPTAAASAAQETTFSIFLVDYHMEQMTGVEFLMLMRAQYPDSVRVMISGLADEDALMDAINEAAIFRFIRKPAARADLLNAMDQSVRLFKLQEKRNQLLALIAEKDRELARRERALAEFKAGNPELFNIVLDEDGAMNLDPDDL